MEAEQPCSRADWRRRHAAVLQHSRWRHTQGGCPEQGREDSCSCVFAEALLRGDEARRGSERCSSDGPPTLGGGNPSIDRRSHEVDHETHRFGRASTH